MRESRESVCEPEEGEARERGASEKGERKGNKQMKIMFTKGYSNTYSRGGRSERKRGK
jgi:hypothetical protein